MAACRSAIEQKTPRRMRCRVILERKFSTALSQEAEVGVKWKIHSHLVDKGVPIMRAANHVNQRSFYFADPDGNVLEIYYEMPYALDLFSNGRSDEDEALPVSGPGEPLPQWLLEDWPAPEMKARIEQLRRQKKRVPV
jgi:hypothetical protein